MEYIKRAAGSPPEADTRIRDRVAEMLARFCEDGESAVHAYARQFDHWKIEFILSEAKATHCNGGLNVRTFMKLMSLRKLDKEANLTFSSMGSQISRTEGMEGQACDWRLRRNSPDREWSFEVYNQKQHLS